MFSLTNFYSSKRVRMEAGKIILITSIRKRLIMCAIHTRMHV